MSLEIKSLADSNVRTLSVIYGQSGTGKTYTISSLKGATLLIDLDYGTACLPPDFPISIVQPESLEETLMFLTANDLSAFDNIVIDNLSALQNLYMSKFKKPQIQDWGACSKLMLRVIDALARITAKGVNVIVLSQEKILNEDNPNMIYYTLNVMDSVRSYIQARSQIIGHTFYNTSSGYCISFEPTDHSVTKLSVYGIKVDSVTSLAEIFDILSSRGSNQPTSIPVPPDAYVSGEGEEDNA